MIGKSVKTRSKNTRMTVSTFFRALLLRERKRLRRSMHRGRKKSDSRKLKIKREPLPKFKGRGSRCSERCTKLEKM